MKYYPSVWNVAVELKDEHGGDWLNVPLADRLAAYRRAEREHFALAATDDPDLLPVRPEWVAQDMLNSGYFRSNVGRTVPEPIYPSVRR